MTSVLPLRNNTDDRIQVLDFPKAAPGKCAICGFAGGIESDERKFIDWGFDLDFYGAIILCEKCVECMANALGFASPWQIFAVEKLCSSLTDRVTELETENAGLRNSIGSFDFLRTLSVPDSHGTEEEKSNDPIVDEQDSSGGPEIVPDSGKSAKSTGPVESVKSEKLLDF